MTNPTLALLASFDAPWEVLPLNLFEYCCDTCASHHIRQGVYGWATAACNHNKHDPATRTYHYTGPDLTDERAAWVVLRLIDTLNTRVECRTWVTISLCWPNEKYGAVIEHSLTQFRAFGPTRALFNALCAHQGVACEAGEVAG